jgi:rhodanese-related sulfurtransferase
MTMIHRISAALVMGVALLTATACGQTKKNINVTEAKALIDKGGVTVLDVRTASEYGGGHLKNAKLIDVTAPGFEQAVAKLDKKKPVVVYCAVGGRSSRAADIMVKSGFTTVYNVSGGYNAWSAAGLPTTR